jgi:dihydrolipoamide dehydrogenase
MDYDLCVIGAGWAGFNAAISASKLGKKACLIEVDEVGGTCLNKGCIPTKALVQYSKQGLSFPEIQKKKTDVIQRLKSGMAYVCKTAGIDYLEGKAKIVSPDTVLVGPDKNIKTKFILVATGSVPRGLPTIKFDHTHVISSDDVLVLDAVPKKMLIIGGGVIGCEFACIFKRLGAEVTIVEICPQILPGLDSQVSKKLQQSLQKSGIDIQVGADCAKFDLKSYDKVLVSVGRAGVGEGLFEKGVEVKLEKGFICADSELRTAVRNIFAAGDCIGGIMLAHVASYEGELAVANMFLKPEMRDYSAVPSSVFTAPEAGSIGASEDDARKSGVDYKASTVHFLSVGMAHVLEDTQGFAKVLVDKKTGCIIGASIIGLHATELINIFSVVMKNKIPIDDLKKTIFAHPSVSEIVAEVAKNFN